MYTQERGRFASAPRGRVSCADAGKAPVRLARGGRRRLAAAVFGGFGFVFGFAGYNRMQEHLRPAQQLGGT